MKKLLTICFLLSLFSTTLHADIGSGIDNMPSDTNPSSPTNSLRRAGGKRLRGEGKGSPANKTPGAINGSCTVVESPGNPFPGPCVEIQLILSEQDSNETIETRTTTKGDFEFIAEAGKTYLMKSGSHAYQVVESSAVVRGGDHVELKLELKN